MKVVGRIAALACAVVLAGSLLTGCAAANGLSRLASCGTLADAGTKLQSAVDDAAADEADSAAAIETLTKAADAFQASTKDMRDAAVKAKSEAVTSSLRTLIADLKQASADPASADASKLADDKNAVLQTARAAKDLCE